ncbi:hypothetical protein chiPu_0021420 [Chiloscyllium punctatum]|uniref:Uncharacterized protein n=1 Tax=Chiloscyllium punctatum TaxID=137246 RepID=A0A401REU4_CHIPU|nr:hypothetical protein [Chiloscyllium punctatum]
MDPDPLSYRSAGEHAQFARLCDICALPGQCPARMIKRFLRRAALWELQPPLRASPPPSANTQDSELRGWAHNELDAK